MKDPSSLSCRTKRPKLKLLVSFNGAFCHRPLSAKFRYTGGETRIISVDRSISFSKLKSKIGDLIPPNGGPTQFSLKYHVSESSSGEPSAASDRGEAETLPLLILLESDDDVRCMVEEYEMVEFRGESLTRLWVFVCHNVNSNDDAFVNENVLRMEGDGFYEGKKGFEENVLEDEGIVSIEEGLMPRHLGRRTRYVNKNTSSSSSSSSSSKKFNDDYSLRKMVLRQLLLFKKLDETPSPRGGVEQCAMVLNGEDEDYESPSMKSCPEPVSPFTFLSNHVNFDAHLSRKVTDYKYVNAHRLTSENFGKVLPVIESNSCPLNSKDGNSGPGSDVSKGDFLGQFRKASGNGNSCGLDSLSPFFAGGLSLMPSYSSGSTAMVNQNMENNGVFPLTGQDLLTGGSYPLKSSQTCERGPGGYQGGIRNRRFGLSEPRSQRSCPYHIWRRSLVTEMGNSRNLRLDGRPWDGKFYPRVRFNSSISKRGAVLKACSDASSKQFSGSRYPRYRAVQEEDGTVDFGRNNHSEIFSLQSSGQEHMIKTGSCRILKHERGSPVESGAAYDGACTGPNHKFPLPIDTAARSSPNLRAVNTQMDLLTNPGTEKLDTVCQALGAKALAKMGMNAEARFDFNCGVHLWNQEEVITSGLPHNLSCSSGKKLNCHGIHMNTESGCGSNIYQRCAHPLEGYSASAVDLSLHNLFLASSRKLQQPSSSSAEVDKSESLVKLQSEDLDLMDEVHLNSSPIVEKSSDAASNSSPNDATRLGSDDKRKQEIHQEPRTSLSIEDKDENEKINKCIKVYGNLRADIASFYTHLATRELQNIKNSDIECIKELGSGTFGTVYYGKWKGSDVAIKRIKPSCFTDGAKEEDRLVADFWKEAHILGQLHHPNIVAFYGVVTDGPLNSLATVTEYMVNGSLRQVLHKKDRTIDRRKRLIIAMDAAFGMEYLHEKNIVHFDLKSHNFLMNTRDPQRPICKIGDLGLSKIKQRTLVSGGVRGTIPWMAPELLNGKSLVSEKVDVYSFAIVMWELLSGEEPYADMRSEEIIAGIILGSLRPEIPSWCDPAWRSLMERCWSSDPDSRPSFIEIAKELRAMGAAINIK